MLNTVTLSTTIKVTSFIPFVAKSVLFYKQACFFSTENNNKDNKFDFVLTYKYGDATVLFVNNAFDITNEVVEGLNKEYASNATTSVDTTKK